jgi:hypothetical protein
MRLPVVKFGVLWTVLFMAADKPGSIIATDTTEFTAAEECAAWGEMMTPRMADYVRGALKLDWDDLVRVSFKCSASGDPA